MELNDAKGERLEKSDDLSFETPISDEEPVIELESFDEDCELSPTPSDETRDISRESEREISSFSDDTDAAWRVNVLGKTYGPASLEVVKAWIVQRRIPRTALVFREGWKYWREAREVFGKELSDALGDAKRTDVDERLKSAANDVSEVSETSLNAGSLAAFHSDLLESSSFLASSDAPSERSFGFKRRGFKNRPPVFKSLRASGLAVFKKYPKTGKFVVVCFALMLAGIVVILFQSLNAPKNEPRVFVPTRVENGDVNAFVDTGSGDKPSESENAAPRETVATVPKSPFYELSPDGKTFLKYTGNGVGFVVPEGIETVGFRAFDKVGSLKTIAIPKSVKTIEEGAFLWMRGVTSYNVAEENVSYRSVGGFLFTKDGKTLCQAPLGMGLKTYEVPEGCEKIEKFAFNECSELARITLPEGFKSIGEFSFGNCVSLTSIAIPESVETVERLAFAGCSSLRSIDVAENNANYVSVDGVLFSKDMKTLHLYPRAKTGKSYSIPDGVETVAAESFYQCPSLEEVVVPASVSVIEPDAFWNCGNLKKIVVYGDAETVDDDAFRGCGGATILAPLDSAVERCAKINYRNYEVLDDVDGRKVVDSGRPTERVLSSDGKKLLKYAGNVSSFAVPDGIEEIGYKAFADDDSLTSITVPSSVKKIDKVAFWRLASLASVEVAEDNPYYKSVDGVLFSKDGKTLCFNPIGARRKKFDAPEGVEEIGKMAFAYCGSLRSVSIPEGVERIGEFSFGGCALTSVDIPKSVEEIGRNAFANCSSIKSINVAEGNLKYVSVDGVLFTRDQKTLIRYPASKAAARYVIPDGVERIEENAFASCKRLESVVVPKGVGSVGRDAFAGCSNLKKIVAPEGVVDVAYDAFLGDLALTIHAPKDSAAYRIAKRAFIRFEPLESGVASEKDNAKTAEADGQTAGYRLSPDGKIFLGYNGKAETFVIPNGVEIIGEGAFANSLLTSVSVPESVVEIRSEAFCRCSWLTSVNIPDAVATVGADAFFGCASLKSVNIPEGVGEIGSWAFAHCHSLKSIDIPKSVVSIGCEAFGYCSSLKSINVAESNPNYVSIDGVLFSKDQKTLFSYPCDRKGTSYDVPESVGEIGEYAFAGAPLSSIAIPGGVEKIGKTPFISCGLLESISVAEDNSHFCSVDGILFSKDKKTLVAYPNGKEGERCVVPEGVATIGDGSFGTSRSLKSIIIPKGVESIGDGAFFNCSSLSLIEIPESVKEIGDETFSNCEFLTIIAPEGSYAEQYAKGNKINFTPTYRLSPDGKTFLRYDGRAETFAIPEGVETIGARAFADSLLKSVGIPEGVKKIEKEAFFHCPSLTFVNIPESVVEIGESAFSRCDSLSSVNIPKRAASIDVAAFAYCSSLESINVAEDNPNYVSVDGVLFSKDQKTLVSYPGDREKHYEIPKSVDVIGDWAFYGCSSLTSVSIPESVEKIGTRAFSRCDFLSSINIPKSVVSIGTNAFAYCSSLGSINVAEDNSNYASVDGVLFSKDQKTLFAYPGNKEGNSCVVPEGVATVGDCAFWACRSLTSITIPESVESIGDRTFYNCSVLTLINLPASVKEIGDEAFGGCASLMIRAPKGSYAERYAQENKIYFAPAEASE